MALSALLIACLLNAQPREGLIGHWRFAGSDGATVQDLSDKGNHGRIEGGQLHAEKATRSLAFDGMDATVTIPETTPFGLGETLTLAAWVRIDRPHRYALLCGRPHAQPTWTTPMFGMYATGNRVVFGSFNTENRKVLVESPALPLRTWVFLAAVADGAKATLFVDGEPVGEAPYSGTIGTNGNPFHIGKPPFTGRIGEVLLHRAPHSPEAIRQLYTATRDGYDQTVAPDAFDPTLRFGDQTVVVESPGRRPDGTWRSYDTRTLDLLAGYKPPEKPVELSPYGGRTDRRIEGTGFFRATKIGDRRWLVDPDGCLTVNLGLGTVRPPPKLADTPFASTEDWAGKTTAVLREHGFNTVGNTSAEAALRQVSPPLVQVVRKNFMSAFAKGLGLTYPTSGHTGFENQCIPVFHPDFAAHCEEHARSLAETKDDPFILGIMSDNELQSPVDLLERHLALNTSNPHLKHGYDAAREWLIARKGSDAVENITHRDRYAFIAFVFERYYRIVTAAIRRHDPNHLYLGSRINNHRGQLDNPLFWQAMAPYVDVVSVNYYNVWGPDREQVAQWEEWGQRPILITEWYTKALDVPELANTHGAGWVVRTQTDRGRFYQHFALGCLEADTIVGWHYFKYRDDPAESTALDSAGGANKGLFTFTGLPHQAALDAAGAVNRQAYALIDFFDARRQPKPAE